MTRKSRVSSYKDYVAIDIVEESGNIKETPFYYDGTPIKVLIHDEDDDIWVKTILSEFNFEKQEFKAESKDWPYTWDQPLSELLEKDTCKFLTD